MFGSIVGEMLMGLGCVTFMGMLGIGGLVYLALKNGLLSEWLPKPIVQKPDSR